MGADNQAEKVLDRIERLKRAEAEIKRLRAALEDIVSNERYPENERAESSRSIAQDALDGIR